MYCGNGWMSGIHWVGWIFWILVLGAVVYLALMRKGQVLTPAGHGIRMVAFGSIEPGGMHRFSVIRLGHIVQFLRQYLRDNWDVLHNAEFKDPAVRVSDDAGKSRARPACESTAQSLGRPAAAEHEPEQEARGSIEWPFESRGYV